MAIINKLINSIGNAASGTKLTTKLKSGNKVTITRAKAADTVEVARTRVDGHKFLTIYKKQKDSFIPVSVEEIMPYGIFKVDYKKDGSKVLTLKAANNYTGNKQGAIKGFYKMLTEKIVYPKGKVIRNFYSEKRLPANEKKASLMILHWLQNLRTGREYFRDF